MSTYTVQAVGVKEIITYAYQTNKTSTKKIIPNDTHKSRTPLQVAKNKIE